jgi:hypothetical protein
MKNPLQGNSELIFYYNLSLLVLQAMLCKEHADGRQKEFSFFQGNL